MANENRIENFEKLEKYNQTHLTVLSAWKSKTHIRGVGYIIYIIEIFNNSGTEYISLYYDSFDDTWAFSLYKEDFTTVILDRKIPTEKIQNPDDLCKFLALNLQTN